MEEQMKQLKEQVEKKTESKDKYNRAFERFQEEQKSTLKEIEDAELVIYNLRTDIKEIALKEYKETGVKKFDCGVGIRIMTNIDYDVNVAFDWAKEHQMALLLDKKAFERHAKVDTPDFVEISEVPIATIPMKL